MAVGLTMLLSACGAPADDPTSPIARIASGMILEDRSPAGSEVDLGRFTERGFCPQAIIPDDWGVLNQRAGGARGADGAQQDPNAVLYQASVTRVSRECRTSGGTITIRLGIAGRVTRGPAAEGLSSIELPLTIEVTDRTADEQQISIQTTQQSVTFTEGQPTALWALVIPNVSAPAGRNGVQLRIGFDPKARGRR